MVGFHRKKSTKTTQITLFNHSFYLLNNKKDNFKSYVVLSAKKLRNNDVKRL